MYYFTGDPYTESWSQSGWEPRDPFDPEVVEPECNTGGDADKEEEEEEEEHCSDMDEGSEHENPTKEKSRASGDSMKKPSGELYHLMSRRCETQRCAC